MILQKTYRIKNKGIESTPHTIEDLRHMWNSGQIDSGTEFQLAGSATWLQAADLLAELEHVPTKQTAPASSRSQPAEGKLSTSLEFRGLNATSLGSVRVTSIKIPFREVLVLVLKFYVAALVLAGAATLLWLALTRFLR